MDIYITVVQIILLIDLYLIRLFIFKPSLHETNFLNFEKTLLLE